MSDRVCEPDCTLGVFPPHFVHCSGDKRVADIPQILSRTVGAYGGSSCGLSYEVYQAANKMTAGGP